MHRTVLFLPLLFALFTVPAAQAGKLYRWVDADGSTHYTDKIPPDQIERSHQELSGTGIRTLTVPRAKTDEEVEEERKLERLRAEQQRLIDKQQAADRVLLRTFRSEEDLIMARDGKLAAIDVMIKVTQGNIRRHQVKLSDLQHRAATREREGRTVTKVLLTNIDNTLRNINDAYANIERKEQGKNAIHQTFARDLKRFRELKNLTQKPAEAEEQETGTLPNLASCSDPQTCDEAWTRAEAFVRANATTPMQMIGDNIIMTAAPTKDRDISITMSRVDNTESGRTVLFMDLFCKDTVIGKEHCQSDSVSAIRQAFSPAVGSAGRE
jgi:hypothetical protein